MKTEEFRTALETVVQNIFPNSHVKTSFGSLGKEVWTENNITNRSEPFWTVWYSQLENNT